VAKGLADGFAQVLLAPPEMSAVKEIEAATSGEPAIEVEFAGTARVRIPGSVPAELAASVVKALSRR
jgi:hypothetical protein